MRGLSFTLTMSLLFLVGCRSATLDSGSRPHELLVAGKSAVARVPDSQSLASFAVPSNCKHWIANGPGPNTLGQVENIAHGEVVGAVNAVAPHPTDASTIYVGAVNGGLWRTTNATAKAPLWTPLSDSAPSLSIGALEFDPTDTTHMTLLAGVGRSSSLLGLGGSLTGLLRTTDGVNWIPLDGNGALRGVNISGVAPRGKTLVIAVDTAETAAARGLWRSTDTGATWTKVSGTIGTGLPSGASFALASDPRDSSVLFAHAFDGLFRSVDTGATWIRVSSGEMATLLRTSDNVDISIGRSKSVFVAIVGNGNLTGLFRSKDSGSSWNALDLPKTVENTGAAFGIHPGGQGGTHLSIAADSTDANIVYIGGDRQPCFTESNGCRAPRVPMFPNSLGANDFSGRIFRVDASRARGSQATAITHSGTASNSAPHADSRDMGFSADGDLIEVDDGGVYRRTAPRSKNGDWLSINGTLQTTEFHAVAWDANADIVIGGAQDTGTSEQQFSSDIVWRTVSAADGSDVAVDDTQTGATSIRYSSFQYLGNFRRRTFNATNELQSEIFPPLNVVGRGNPLVAQFYTPIRLNNVNPNRLILGGANSVYESFDQGQTIREIGVGIVINDTGTDPIAYGAASNDDMLYVASDTNVFIRNAPPPAPLTASSTYPGVTEISDIAIDPSTPNSAFVLDGTNVYRTADGGGTWTTVAGNLETLSPGTLHSIVYRSTGPPAVVVGSDTGVFIALGPTFNSWASLGCGLPRVPVYDLEFDARDRILVAGTLGRGAWVLDDD